LAALLTRDRAEPVKNPVEEAGFNRRLPDVFTVTVGEKFG
jgi:hypothetical protein